MAKRVERRLAAILAADIVGYSRLMEGDEEGTLKALRDLRSEVIDARIATYNGRIVNFVGDAMLAEFSSAVDAVACAIDIQEALAKHNLKIPDQKRIAFRIGINLGDVIVQDDDLYGDGVNIAARLEQLADSGGVCISSIVRELIEGKLEVMFADAGNHQVKNISRPLSVFRWSPLTEAAAALASVSSKVSIAQRPSIAVLPFRHLSGDDELRYLVDGLTEDVIAALSRVRWLLVIARNSTFAYKGRSVDAQQVAEELSVRYVLEGSIRTADKRIRVAAQLIDTSSRAQLWAKRYDRSIEDIFALQDEITEAIVGAVEPELGAAELNRAHRVPPGSLDAWGYYQRGLWAIWSQRSTGDALRFFDQAIALDSDFSGAHSGKSFAHALSVFLDQCDNPEEELAKALDSARQAVALDNQDAFAHCVLGRAHFFRREHDQAIEELEFALKLNPSFAHAYFLLGWVLTNVSRSEESLPHLDMGYQLSPNDPTIMGNMVIRAIALMFMGQLDEALRWARESARHPSAHFQSRSVLVSVLGRMGHIDEAKAVLADILKIRPDYSFSMVEKTQPYKHRRDLDYFIDGLRKAGLPS